MNRAFLASVVVLGLLLTAAARGEEAAVTIEHHASVASTRYFDRDHPTPGMPALSPDEAGVTVSEFSCTALVSGTFISQSKTGGGTQSVVRVDGVHLVLRLTVTEWVSRDSKAKILAHENGHHRISEHFYGGADAIARDIGNRFVGQQFIAQGKDREAAANAALTDAAGKIAAQYMTEVRDPSEKVQVTYDRITAHGTNDIDEDEAIKQALKEAAGKED